MNPDNNLVDDIPVNLKFWKVPNYLDKQLSEYKGNIVTRFPPEPR